VASRTPSKQPSPAALEYARALVEYADGLRAEPPRAGAPIPAVELYLALRALGRDPVEVARKARERWERQAVGAPAETAPAPQGAAPTTPGGSGELKPSVRVRVGGGTTVYVLLPGGSEWKLLREVVGKRVEWVKPSEGFLDVEAGDLPVGSVVREVTWGKRGPAERFFSVQPRGLREEAVAREEDEPAGAHLGHELRARVAVMESGLRVPLYWFVASGPLKGSVRARDSLAGLKRDLEETVERWLKRGGAQVPDDVKRAVLGVAPSWADGAYVKGPEYFSGGDVHRAVPAPPGVREKVVRILAGWIRSRSPPGGEPLPPVAPTRALGELFLVPEPPQQLAKLVDAMAWLRVSGGRLVSYAQLKPGSVPDDLARELDREVPGWREGGLLVALVPFGGRSSPHVSDLLNRFYRAAERLPGLTRGSSKAEVVARGAEELAKWEYAVVTRGGPVSVVRVVPLKRSSRGEGYYYSTEWSTSHVALDMPPLQAERLLKNLVVLRDGTTYRAEGVPGRGGYVNIPPPPEQAAAAGGREAELERERGRREALRRYRCPECGRQIVTDGYMWECPECGAGGLLP
jgi:predicted RNA-binding Zn-ribbon protein involved in translation (DUF1610 family)